MRRAGARAGAKMRQWPVSRDGAATGLDCADPCSRSQTLSSTSTPTGRDSDCQFWNDANQKRLPTTYCSAVTGGPPCCRCASVYSRAPPTACAAKIVAPHARIGVGLLRLLQVLRLRRAALVELRRQQHEDPHLQELGLPVLGQRLDEGAGAQVRRDAHGGLPVILLVLRVLRRARQDEPHQRDREQPERHQAQAVLQQEATRPAGPVHRAHAHDRRALGRARGPFRLLRLLPRPSAPHRAARIPKSVAHEWRLR